MSEAPVLVEISLRLNGDERSVVVDTRTSLLDLLREHLGLTGAKKGCDLRLDQVITALHQDARR